MLTDDLSQQTALRIKELPAELRRDNMDLKSEALRLMNSGDLDEAVKCLFGYQLLLLDRHGFLRLSRGKTNNRYVSEVRTRSSDATSLLRSTVDAFEASYFESTPRPQRCASDFGKQPDFGVDCHRAGWCGMIRLVVSCVLLCLTVGCSRFETEYGQFAGGTSESSINGLGCCGAVLKMQIGKPRSCLG